MDILFITTQFPYPLDNGGKIGAYNGIKVVSNENNVRVLSFTEEIKDIEEGAEFFNEHDPNIVFEEPVFHDIHIRRKILKLIKVMLKSYILKTPYIVEKFEDFRMYKKIDKMFENKTWDLIFIDYLNMNIYAEYIRKKYRGYYRKLILKDHNLEYEIIKQASDNCKGLKKYILNYEWKRTLTYEINAVKNADIVYSVCNNNTNFFKKYNEKSFSMLPTYSVKEKTYKHVDSNGILFIGSLSWGANLAGIQWFVDEVLPIINNCIKNVKLTIIGGGLPKNSFYGNPLVDYKGYVKDLTGIYDNYSVFVVPLFEGSGIRIKILEAFDNEIAVVSTLIGCETIGAQNGREIYIADTKEQFAEAVIRLLRNPELRKDMACNAKKYLERNFSLEARQREFKEQMMLELG